MFIEFCLLIVYWMSIAVYIHWWVVQRF